MEKGDRSEASADLLRSQFRAQLPRKPPIERAANPEPPAIGIAIAGEVGGLCPAPRMARRRQAMLGEMAQGRAQQRIIRKRRLIVVVRPRDRRAHVRRGDPGAEGLGRGGKTNAHAWCDPVIGQGPERPEHTPSNAPGLSDGSPAWFPQGDPAFTFLPKSRPIEPLPAALQLGGQGPSVRQVAARELGVATASLYGNGMGRL